MNRGSHMYATHRLPRSAFLQAVPHQSEPYYCAEHAIHVPTSHTQPRMSTWCASEMHVCAHCALTGACVHSPCRTHASHSHPVHLTASYVAFSHIVFAHVATCMHTHVPKCMHVRTVPSPVHVCTHSFVLMPHTHILFTSPRAMSRSLTSCSHMSIRACTHMSPCACIPPCTVCTHTSHIHHHCFHMHPTRFTSQYHSERRRLHPLCRMRHSRADITHTHTPPYVLNIAAAVPMTRHTHTCQHPNAIHPYAPIATRHASANSINLHTS
jgi:hypothetical protein